MDIHGLTCPYNLTLFLSCLEEIVSILNLLSEDDCCWCLCDFLFQQHKYEEIILIKCMLLKWWHFRKFHSMLSTDSSLSWLKYHESNPKKAKNHLNKCPFQQELFILHIWRSALKPFNESTLPNWKLVNCGHIFCLILL